MDVCLVDNEPVYETGCVKSQKTLIFIVTAVEISIRAASNVVPQKEV